MSRLLLIVTIVMRNHLQTPAAPSIVAETICQTPFSVQTPVWQTILTPTLQTSPDFSISTQNTDTHFVNFHDLKGHLPSKIKYLPSEPELKLIDRSCSCDLVV